VLAHLDSFVADISNNADDTTATLEMLATLRQKIESGR